MGFSAYEFKRLFLNVPGGNLSLDNAWDINDSGDIVGYYFQSDTGTHGFIYNLETKTTTPVDFPGADAATDAIFQAQTSEDLIAYADVIQTEESALSTDGITEYIIHVPTLQGVETTFACLVAKPIVH